MKAGEKTLMVPYQNFSARLEQAEASAQNMFTRITSKWAVQVLVALKEGNLRFSQLKKNLHTVTDRMLIKTLHELEADGFICRNVYEVDCKKIFYSLSPEGDELAALLQHLTAWLRGYALSALNAVDEKLSVPANVE
ncbi:winged helix-turn-helix transcriptional regulator [Pantoea stewartii]|uniref:winged helix-turn-helix transcriptional regulator n=1 Tax=Pantoea stewartii TaxID=66269 RepID=UPI0023F724E4|nr:winged helix-turn-helix transcriptional regulator [Pantoea stewartii]MDF7788483.1 winged helix-turn-helix transcriptional regulator [Pantoea stewartii]